MFCPICWHEYPKGMLKCDHCSAELIAEKPEGLKEKERQKASKTASGAAGEEKKKEK